MQPPQETSLLNGFSEALQILHREGEPSPGHPDSCNQALRDIAEPQPHSLCQLPMPGSQTLSQNGPTATCVSTQRREGTWTESVKAIPTTAARNKAKSGVKMYIHSWHLVPLRKIPCLSGHLLFLPTQQPGLASGSSFPNLP